MRRIFVRLAVFSGENLFSPQSPDFLQIETAVNGYEPLVPCMSTTSYSTAPSVTYFTDISCEFMISGFAILAVNFLNHILVALKNFFHHLSGGKNFSMLKIFFFTAFIALSANLTLFIDFHRKFYIFQQFLAVTPRPRVQ